MKRVEATKGRIKGLLSDDYGAVGAILLRCQTAKKQRGKASEASCISTDVSGGRQADKDEVRPRKPRAVRRNGGANEVYGCSMGIVRGYFQLNGCNRIPSGHETSKPGRRMFELPASLAEK